ncbi:MAG TPA: hypothetical protein VJA21_24685 [Verrucomicrobiae bacterium]
MNKLTIIILSLVLLIGVLASLMVQQQAQAKRRTYSTLIQQQANRVAELTAEQQHLSGSVAQASNLDARMNSAELSRLRTQAMAFRKQIEELEKVRAGKLSMSLHQACSVPDHSLRGGSIGVVSDSGAGDYNDDLYKTAWSSTNNPALRDAFNLKYAIWQYTVAHQGQFPTALDEVAPYTYKGQNILAGTLKERDPMAGADEFDLVYQGSRQDLVNVPEEAVAMLRERQPWPTPAGKWARTYAMANGHIIIVESDDDFRSWESQHIVPPPPAESRAGRQ